MEDYKSKRGYILSYSSMASEGQYYHKVSKFLDLIYYGNETGTCMKESAK